MNKKTTIDEIHCEKLNTFFTKETKNFPKLVLEKKELLRRLKSLKDNQIDEIMELKDKIKNINQEIKNISQEKKNYLLKNSKDIFVVSLGSSGVIFGLAFFRVA